MYEERKDLLMQVDGMTEGRCVDALRQAVQQLDPEAKVEVDLAHGRAAITTRAQTLEVAEAINKAGFAARAMSL